MGSKPDQYLSSKSIKLAGIHDSSPAKLWYFIAQGLPVAFQQQVRKCLLVKAKILSNSMKARVTICVDCIPLTTVSQLHSCNLAELWEIPNLSVRKSSIERTDSSKFPQLCEITKGKNPIQFPLKHRFCC